MFFDIHFSEKKKYMFFSTVPRVTYFTKRKKRKRNICGYTNTSPKLDKEGMIDLYISEDANDNKCASTVVLIKKLPTSYLRSLQIICKKL